VTLEEFGYDLDLEFGFYLRLLARGTGHEAQFQFEDSWFQKVTQLKIRCAHSGVPSVCRRQGISTIGALSPTPLFS